MTREIVLERIAKAAEQGLTELDLSGLNLTEMPLEVCNLTQLESLTLGEIEKGIIYIT